MNTLDVVNSCLATVGELPLNSLNDPHDMRYAATSLLVQVNKKLQSKGRWYNQEYITLQPDTVDSKVYVPGDTVSFRATNRNTVIRGRILYDLGDVYNDGTPIRSTAVHGQLIRLVPFEQLPESAAAYIAAETTLSFQMKYDGDMTKARMLQAERDAAKIEENIEHTRNRKTNLIDSNSSLQRLKYYTRGARRFVNAP